MFLEKAREAEEDAQREAVESKMKNMNIIYTNLFIFMTIY